MSDEGLEIVRHGFLSIVIPDLQQVVFSAGEHVASISRQVSACNSALVDSVQFTKVSSFESCKTVNSDALVLCHNDNLAVVLRELETADNVTDLDLMLKNNRLGAVDHQIVSIFSHNSEEGVHNNEFLTIFSKVNVFSFSLHFSVAHG